MKTLFRINATIGIKKSLSSLILTDDVIKIWYFVLFLKILINNQFKIIKDDFVLFYKNLKLQKFS